MSKRRKKKHPKPIPVFKPDPNAYPEVGETYYDYGKRKLVVTEFNPNDEKGREVIGIVDHTNHPEMPYSCTLELWREIWRDKVQPVPPKYQTFK